MNPFDLAGPQFLLFYFVLLCTVVVLLKFVQKTHYNNNDQVRALEAEAAKDPYLIACMRGGSEAVTQVALVSLVERGLLEAEGNTLKAVAGAAGKARRPLDQAILWLYEKPGEAKLAFRDPVVISELTKIYTQFSTLKYLGHGRKDRLSGDGGLVFLKRGAIAFLWLVALAKIAIALERGHRNIWFLVGIALLAPLVVSVVKVRDDVAVRALRGIRERFSGLSKRASSLEFNGKTGDLVFYTAIFGFARLPAAIASVVERLDLIPQHAPQPSRTVVFSSGSWSSSGSSCGSSSGGSSCGSSCGSGCGGCGSS